MANQKISEDSLLAAADIDGATDYVPIVDPSEVNASNRNKRSLLNTIADWVVKTALSFVQSGTGAVARTTQSKLRDIVNARDVGILCNGVTDDTAAWIAALPDLNGRTLRLPEGVAQTSVVSASLTLPRSIRIIGGGRRGVLDAPNTIGSGKQGIALAFLI